MQSQPVGHIFSRSWHLLTNNWILLVPGLLIGVASGILSWLLVPADNPETVPGIVRQLGLQLLAGIIVLVAQIATTAYTTGMAGAAWTREKTSLSDGRDAFARDGVNVFVAMIGLGVAGVVAIVLAPPTLGISLIAYYLLSLYTMPAAVVGERPGLRALQESFSIAIERFFPTLLIAIFLGVVYLVVGLLAGLVAAAPLVGLVGSAIIIQCVTAFATLVIVGEYLELRASRRVV